MTDEKQQFTIVGDLPMVAGQKPDENGYVWLTESEALYERAVGRIVPVETVDEAPAKAPARARAGNGAPQDAG